MSEKPNTDLSQVAQWRTWKLLLLAVGMSVAAGTLKAIGDYLVLERDRSLYATVNDATWFAIYLLLFWLAVLFWTRRQARRGRHTWLTENDDEG